MTRETLSSQYTNPNAPSPVHGSHSEHGGGGTGGGTTTSLTFFLRPMLFLAVALLCLGCGPGSPTQAPAPLVHAISATQLATIFRHSPRDRTWVDQHVECKLEPKSYSVHPDRIEAHCVNAGRSGCVHFTTAFAPKDNLSPLTITGICRGIVRDGQFREPGVDYYVRVEVLGLR